MNDKRGGEMIRIAKIATWSMIVILTLVGWSLAGPFPEPGVSVACDIAPPRETMKPLKRVKSSSRPPDKDKKLRVMQTYGRLPLYFIENQGQMDENVKFYVKGGGQTICFTHEEIVSLFWRQDRVFKTGCTDNSIKGNPSLRVRENHGDAKDAGSYAFIRLRPLGMKPDVEIIAQGPQAGKVHYLIGKDPHGWRTDIPTYSAVVYREAYPGIDLKFYGTNRQLEYDVVVKPGGDPSLIKFRYKGIEGLQVTGQGDLALRLKGGGGELIQKKPVVYQQIDRKRVRVKARFKVLPPPLGDQGFVYAFEVDAYDKKYALIIDPILIYASYLGGVSDDEGLGIAVDGSGHSYVTGWTQSTDFPITADPYQGSLRGNSDVFVAKFNATGDGLVYATYLGGGSDDQGIGITVDGSGHCYVTGWTQSTDFPTENPFQNALGGEVDAFLTKLNAAGNGLVYSTYLGGFGSDKGALISADGSGSCYVTGWTQSTDFPITADPYQGSLRGNTDAFVTKFNAAGNGLVYATYLGGSASDEGFGIAVDSSGHCYVTGWTGSTDFPTQNPFQASLGGNADAFVTKFNAAGNGLVYATYLGGSYTDAGAPGSDYGFGIAVSDSGHCYVVGWTDSLDFPTQNPFQASRGGDFDVFVAKFNATGDGLVYATYLGGRLSDYGIGIALDDSGQCYVTGLTDSNDFPTTEDAFQVSRAGVYDGFVTAFNAGGNSLSYSTYLGGATDDSIEYIAVDDAGNCYVTGWTESTDFPTEKPFQGVFGGACDAFVAKFGEPPVADFSANPRAGVVPLAVNFIDLSTGTITQWLWDFGDSRTSTEKNPSHLYRRAGTYSVSLTVKNTNGSATEAKTGYIDISSCPYGRVRIGEEYYATIQEAYTKASDGDVIQCQALDFPEDLELDGNIRVTIKGGYDCGYATNKGDTRIKSMIIRNGTVTTEKLTLSANVQILN